MQSATLLASISVRNLVGSTRPLIVIYTDETIGATLTKLSQNNIIAAPVIERTNTFLGIITVSDIVAFVVRIVRSFSSNRELSQESLQQLALEAKIFTGQVVGTIFENNIATFPLITQSTSLLTVVQYLAKYHMLPVFEDSKVMNLITQSDIAEFLIENGIYFPTLMNKNVTQLNLGSMENVVKVSRTASTIECLHIMHDRQVSCVAIVDMEDHLIENFSRSDIREISEQSFRYLALPAIEYLNSIHFKKVDQHTLPLIPLPPVACNEGTSLEAALLRMSRKRVHRIYLIASDRRIRGLITFTDILKLFCQTF